ncbi:MAG TPA: type II toxin-antitoxin system prevent-host-death family antitoxin [Phycisphaerae bacterium]|nr:type II toxin-antitoxin system prevent-host-death family antitoxin [Phycisphaerae bacterium]HUT56771.1 type II toxin-antitoxin system prevent-host-death family antitoxin [Phycisphaerae bacterium]
MGKRRKAVPFTQARSRLSDLFTRVVTRRERVVIERHGHERAAIVPVEDMEALERLEDQLDVAAAEAALAESDDRIPWERVKKDLGL